MTCLQVCDLALTVADRCYHSLNLMAEGGQIWAILGPNGVGKTTLLQTLAGLRQPQAQANIFIDDCSLQRMDRHSIAQRMAILLQDDLTVFPETVRSCVAKGCYPQRRGWRSQVDPQVIAHAVQTVALQHKEHALISELSGGERRRLALAMVLAQQTDILLLDEPCNHLDLRHQLLILQHLYHLAQQQQKLLMLVLHDLNFISRYCSHALLLFEQGDIMLGPVQQILQREHLQRLYQCELLTVSSEVGSLWTCV